MEAEKSNPSLLDRIKVEHLIAISIAIFTAAAGILYFTGVMYFDQKLVCFGFFGYFGESSFQTVVVQGASVILKSSFLFKLVAALLVGLGFTALLVFVGDWFLARTVGKLSLGEPDMSSSEWNPDDPFEEDTWRTEKMREISETFDVHLSRNSSIFNAITILVWVNIAAYLLASAIRVGEREGFESAERVKAVIKSGCKGCPTFLVDGQEIRGLPIYQTTSVLLIAHDRGGTMVPTDRLIHLNRVVKKM